jgi:hypothetical protein
MPTYISDQLFALALLSIAAILTIYLYLRHLERQNRPSLERSNPELPDLTPHFIELQGRIASEAEETRKQADRHQKNTQQGVKLLAEGVRRQRSVSQEVIEAITDAITKAVEEDGEKTRERVAQVKTRLADEERDDQEVKRQARTGGNSVYMPASSADLVVGPDDTEIRTEDGQLLGYIVREGTVVGTVKDKRKTDTRRAASTPQNPKASK